MSSTLAFELSGEHQTLPRSEALALLDLYARSYRETSFLDQCLVVKADGLDFAALEKRLAMTHRIIEVLAECDACLESIAASAQEIELPCKSYSIRARRVKQAALPGDLVEREVGRALFKKGYKADLSRPEVLLRAIITDQKVILGLERARPDRSGFESRRPHLKPFFHPGVLMPRMARTLVNLSRAREGEWLLDPFSGTAGILVEACLVGIKGVGLEVQKKLIRGAQANTEGLDCSLLWGDARCQPFMQSSIDAAVLDIPYGRSALIHAPSKEALLEKALAELYDVLKPARHMVIAADGPIQSLICGAGFEIQEIHMDRVHKSLTRHIFLCQK